MERIDEYRRVLESYSKRLLPLIEWEPTENMNVRVLNDTGDFYSYFDATPHVEFYTPALSRQSTSIYRRKLDFYSGMISLKLRLKR